MTRKPKGIVAICVVACVLAIAGASPSSASPGPSVAVAGPPTTGTLRIAVVLIRYPGSTVAPTRSIAQGVMFGPSWSVAQWLAEVSGNALSVTGTVFGPYDSPLPRGACEIPDWTAAGEAIAAPDGYSRAAYDDIVIATPSDNTCHYAGIGTFGGRGVRLNGAFNVGAIVHELGHNFSLAHAGTLACGAAQIGGSCQAVQYGDPYDVMGRPAAALHYSAAHKYMLGWLRADEVATVTTGARTLGLSPSAQRAVGSTQLILVPLPNGTKYAIERRASFGTFDRTMSGVWIRVYGKPGTATLGGDDTQLLDMTPGSANGFADANLAQGMSFVDSANNVTVRNLKDTASSSVLQVCVGPCPAAPEIRPLTIGAYGSAAWVLGTNGPDRVRMARIGTGGVEINTGGWPFTITAGCVEYLARAFCEATRVNVYGMGGDDSLIVDGPLRGTLYGDSGNDVLHGGTGADDLWGGLGSDTVDYSDRGAEAIHGTPGTGPDDGRPGEGDNIRGDVEQVRFPGS